MLKDLWELFYTFAKVGVMTFGGGYAMLPILQREVVEKKGWATDEELTDYFAIGQCTPGVIAVNTATFVGRGSILGRRLLTACGHSRADGWHQADAQGIHKGGRQGKQSHAEGVFPVEGRGSGF